MQFNSQVITFLITIATGILLGVLFDGYRVLRGTFRPKVLTTWFTDLLYWLLATVIVFLALVISNWGELRFYVFLGIISGVVFYYRLLSLYTIRLFSVVIKLIKKTTILVKRIFMVLIIKPVLLCMKIIGWPFKFTNRKMRTWYRKKYPKPPIDEKK
ncbi:spore cortex biosynthesis protein YabQ [Pelosinus sp. IPA-1]|uniref:spore cortex biosynthesis protein YabQ n=1 Tax=Pelosinus sp. IPA-1 TaxID=3029569 RepID=UPI0024362453|nr:spore cortex biosynthesis protein YabQ [Pelosinus sp. IPA-1]GMA99114.1 hypothetical protein PIPA1_19140 [Pelosinus sp. IPA-1]